MDTRLTARERVLLAEIEHRLRRTDPRLDRRLARRPGPVARCAHRPGVLVVTVALSATAAAAAALWAGALWVGAGGPWAAPAVLLAVGAALLSALALRRLARRGGA
ncbi:MULTISPECIES: DUF3040 domain-containing protein [Kitasatospora]|uniref:DUF3040 domain-containing protein n=1 Tax=Kitasatospora setae (strain ATCC 33774 / DSM 43861 / JCM 3304 / KCC A-0304 / NBRC 14216 / KM-6054) TaxID=452652 RepID=E4N5K5_KITSK|nr:MULTISPECIES: DUF3040 domain-containing protein [Kitasatospora]BAJ26486.1 hypothetical protein KSE_06460 [Kitasatospora setae KM-6054]